MQGQELATHRSLPQEAVPCFSALSQTCSHWEWDLDWGFSPRLPSLHWTCVHKPKRVEEENDGILGPRIPSSSGKPMVLELLFK